MFRALAVLVATAACGRVGFDARPDGGSEDPDGDAPGAGACAELESVMSGDLVIEATEVMKDAAITVPLSRTILFTTMRENEESPAYGATHCELRVDRIRCERENPGTDRVASDGRIHVHWTAVTFSSGVSVQRGVTSSGIGPLLVTIADVPLAESFILLGGASENEGQSWASNELVRAQLLDSGTLEIRSASDRGNVSWQVVQMAGAKVERGSAAMPAAMVFVTAPLVASDTSGSFALASYQIGAGSIGAGGTMADAGFASSADLVLSRKLTGPDLDFSWEVVTPPFAVERGTISLGTGMATLTLPVSTLDPATSVAFASGQSLLGPSGGTTIYNGSGNAADLVGEALATFAMTGSGMVITRSTATAAATWSFAAIDFGAPRCPN